MILIISIISFFVNLVILIINQIIKLKKLILLILKKLIFYFIDLEFFNKDDKSKIKSYKKLLLYSKKINSKVFIRTIENQSYLSLCKLYAKTKSFDDSKYYFTEYFNKRQIPIIEEKNQPTYESFNNFILDKKTKKYNLNLLCIFDDDSTLFIMLNIYKQFIDYCNLNLLLLNKNNISNLSDRQLQNIPSNINLITMESEEFFKGKSQKFISSYDAIFSCKPIPTKSNFFKLEKRPKIVHLYMGIDFFPIEGFKNRANADIVCFVQKSQLELSKKLMPNYINNYQNKIHYNPKFLSNNQILKSNIKDIKNIYFLTQSIVPSDIKGRKHMLNMLIEIAKKNTDKSIKIKLRHLENENKGHKHQELYSYKAIARNIKLPENLTFTDQPFEEVLQKADYCITCSSTAGVETILRGIPTSFYFNYPKAEENYLTKPSKEIFINSGLIATYNEIISLKCKKVKREWIEDFSCKRSSIINILEKLSDLKNEIK